MVIDVTKHNASILAAGENTIACANITEAFLDVFSVDYGKDFAIIKQAHRYINNNPVIKVDVVINEHLYKDVEFILIKSNEQGIFINENSLANSTIIEQHAIEVAPEEATVAEHCAHEIDATLDSVVIEEIVPEIDVANLKQQAKQQQQNKVLQQLQMIQEELSDQMKFEMQQTNQSLFNETLAIQNKIQTDNAQKMQQSIEDFRVQLKQWALDVQQHLAEYVEEAIADAELQLMENSKQLLLLNKQQTLDELQHEISATTINSMAAIKETLNAEIAAQLKTLDEHHQQKDNAIETFVQEQMHQLHMQIESAQMQSFDAKVAELLMKQHEWLQQNINKTTDAYDAKLDAMHNQLNKVVVETSADVASCIKGADATIEAKISAALQQLNEKANELHQERMQTIEQSVADVLKENLADDQTDVISEARASARNAVKGALASYKSDISKELNAQLQNIQKELHNKLQLYAQSYAGGGSVAAQFADGGTMNGTLNVANGQILSAGIDLASIFAGGGDTTSNFLSLTGGTVSGDVVVTGALSATTFYATSAFITVVDITQYELSGFTVTGNVTVNGTISSSQVVYANGGNSNSWNSSYTTVNANSATWLQTLSFDVATGNLTISNGNTTSLSAFSNLSAANLFTSVIDFQPLTAAPIHIDGRLYYDANERTLVFMDGDPTLSYPINKMLWTIGVNKTGSTIPKGTVVYLSGAQGNRGKMWPAIATSDLRSADTIGITMQSTAINQEGYIMAIGELEGIDTRAFAEGTTLYLSPTAAGGITDVKPQAPNHIVKVGFSLNSTVNGKIYVEIDNGYELNELHNVRINGVSNGQGLVYNSASALWVNSDLYNGSDLKALSAAWQSTYTSFNAQSGNYATLASNTFSGVQILPSGSETSPSLTFSALASGAGIYSSESNILDFTTNGSRKWSIDSNGTLYNRNHSVATSTPIISAAQTWNSAGTTFIGNTFLFTRNAAAAGSLMSRWATSSRGTISFDESGEILIGIFGTNGTRCGNAPAICGMTGGSLHVGCVNGNAYIGNTSIFGANLLINGIANAQRGSSTYQIQWSSDSTTYGTPDLSLRRASTGALIQHNGTSPQAFYVANTFTSTTNYERFTIDWQTKPNTCVIGTSAGSAGGSTRGLDFRVGTNTVVSMASASNNLSFFSDQNNYAGGSKIMFISNATTAPTANPINGGYMFISAGELKYMGSAGTITTLAPA